MEPFVGEIRTFAFDRIPNGWLPCEGQVLQIKQYQALYTLIGSFYGPVTSTTFTLPDLRGRVMMGMGASTAIPSQNYNAGNNGGKEGIGLTANQLPPHTHEVSINSGLANKPLQAGNTPAAKPQVPALGNENINAFVTTSAAAGSLVALNSQTISTTGAGAPHENRMPYTALQECIAIMGIYPTRP